MTDREPNPNEKPGDSIKPDERATDTSYDGGGIGGGPGPGALIEQAPGRPAPDEGGPRDGAAEE